MGKIQIYKKPISARKILSMTKTNVGDKLLFVNGTKGIVISGYSVYTNRVVNGKAVLLTDYQHGGFWGDMALEWLKYPVKKIERIQE